MGSPLTLINRRRRVGTGFNPLGLFSNGSVGAFYDFNDTTTQFQSNVGASQITATGQGVGLILDKSRQLALGAERWTNPATNVTGGWSHLGGGQYSITAGTIGDKVGNLILTNLSFDLISVRVVSISGTLSIRDGGTILLSITAPGTYFVRRTSAAPGRELNFSASTALTAVIDSISCRSLAGNHATQATAANEPTYQNDGRGYVANDGGDSLAVTLPNLGTDATRAYCDQNGVTILQNQTINGATTLPTSTKLYWVIYLDRALTEQERQDLIRYGGDFVADLYADSVLGNDANDGLSPGTAFATIGTLETEALASGNGVTVGLARGSEWREFLDLSTLSSARVRGYGPNGSTASALPKLDCADVAANGDFSLAPTFTNTYQITWTHEIDSDISKRKLRVWEDGARLKWVSSIALCEAEAGTFHVQTSSIANPATIYVHPNGSTNPTSDGKTYEITAREYGLKIGAGYDVRHVHTTRNANHNGSFEGGLGGYGEGILSTDGVVHCQWVSIGSTHVNCVAYDCEPSTWRSLNATLFVSYNATGGSGAVYRQCYAYSPAASGQTHDGYYFHTQGGANRLQTAQIEECFYYGPSSATLAADTDAIVVNGFFAEFASGRPTSTIGFGASSGLTNSFNNITALNPARLFQTAENLIARDLRVYVADAISGGMFWTTNVNIQNSTFVFASGLTTAQALMFNTTGDAAVFQNNVMQNAGFRSIKSDGSISSDFNVIRIPGAATGFLYDVNGTGYSFANWKIQTGGDASTSFEASNSTAICTDPANNDFTFTTTLVDEGGRAAGSRKTIARPNWATLTAAWDAGFLGIDGTGP